MAKEERIIRSQTDPIFFYTTYFKEYFHVPCAAHHQELLNLLKHKNRPTLGIVPRGAGLSTLVLAEICRQTHVSTQENFTLFYFTYNKSVAKTFLNKLYHTSIYNRKLYEDFTLDVRRVKQGLEYSNGNRIYCFGWEQPLVDMFRNNIRPNCIIGHDLYTERDDKLYDTIYGDWMQMLQASCDGGGNLWIVGNIIGSALEKLKQDTFSRVYICNAVQTTSEASLWDGGESYWPERYSIDDLKCLYDYCGYDVFMREYQHSIEKPGIFLKEDYIV